MSIEKIVRPFQTNNVFGARTLPPNQAPSPQLVATDSEPAEPAPTLTWSGSADAIWTVDAAIMYGFKVTDWGEDRRETDKVRVENPNDASQFVEVERIKKIVFKNQSNNAELPLTLNWDT